MYGSIAELMANLPDFQRMKVTGGESKYRQPVMPGEQRLTPDMQERMQQNLRLPARGLPQAQVSPEEFLFAYLSGSSGGSNVISPDTAQSLAGIEYMSSGGVDFNPDVARRKIASRASEILRG